MIVTYFKLSYRSLINKKINTIISVIGLGIGLAAVMLVSAYIFNEYSFDKFHQNYNRIYRLVNKTRNTAKIDKEYATSLIDALPSIEKVCRINIFHGMIGTEDNPLNTDRLAIADSTFFQIFNFPLLLGSPEDVLDGPNKIVLSKSFAAKMFPETSPIGKIVRIDMNEYCTVTGIMKDSPSNSSIQPEAVVSLYTKNMRWTGGDYWNNNGKFHVELYQYYILSKNESDTIQTLKYLHSTYSEKWASEKPDLICQPLSEIYFTTGIEEAGSVLHTNKKLLFLLLSIGLIVLLLAIINTFNILLSESLEETKRASILKTTGAGVHHIIWQGLITISLVLFLSLILAFVIIYMALPWFIKEVERQISFETFLSPTFLLFVTVTFILLVIIIGLYPSIHFARTNPMDLLRKNGFKNVPFQFFSRALLIFQFIVSIVLIISIITIVKQTRFVKFHQLGYKPENLLFIPIHYNFSKQTLTLKQELLKNPSILQVSASCGTPGNVYSFSDSKINEKDMSYWEVNCDEDFFSTLGIKLKEGRFFLPSEKGRACIVNEVFYKEAGFKSISTANCKDIPVVGIVKNFNTESLHNDIKPGAIFLSDANLICLTLKISPAKISATLDYIEKVWKSMCPDFTLNYTFYEDMIEKQYQQEKRLLGTIGASSVIAIFISCLGLLSMILFVMKKRTKEIGLRKINGATVIEVMLELNMEFVMLVTIAFFIAIPIAYYSMHRWLENFSFKTELNWWVFVLSGLLTLCIALLTVSWQIWRAATLNPVTSLKYE